jgi:dihydroflavonol-4-reductase
MSRESPYQFKKVLITGGTGFVGSNLAEALLKLGCEVRILRRENSSIRALDGLAVEHFIGDILNMDALHQAMDGCDTVFHTAALVAMWKGKKKEQEQINVTGTRNVVESALKANIKRFVHTSSVATIGYKTDGTLADESTPFNWQKHLGYKYTKHLAELEVLKLVDKGLPAIIVNPGIIIGPRDYRFHGGKLIRDVKRGLIPFYVDGGINVVYIDDVVFGHIQAAKIGIIGERYILGGTNLTIKDSFDQTAEIVAGRSPKFKIMPSLVKLFAKSFDLYGTITGIQPWVSSDLVANLGIKHWFNLEKAIRELNYEITPFNEAVAKTYTWYKIHGILK